MNRNTSIIIAVIILLIIISIIGWLLSVQNQMDTAQDDYPLTSTSAIPRPPDEDLSVDTSVNNDLNRLEQELQGL